MPPSDDGHAKPCRVLIVDDHPIVREGLKAQLATQADMELCGEAEDMAGALLLFRSTRPDLAVVDISLRNGNGIELVKRIRAHDAATRIIVWSMYPDELYAERALRAGAQGYVNKGRSIREIFDALRSVRDGRTYVSEDHMTQVFQRLAGGSGAAECSDVETLSDRELEVFELMGRGRTTEEIAGSMKVSPKTVETYRARIKEKLKVDNVTELVSRATEWLLENR